MSGRTGDHSPTPIGPETTELRFGRIPLGESVARPVVVTGPPGHPLELVVVEPPLAPFSLCDPPAAARGRPVAPDRSELWVRYDAARSMARDEGRLVVAAVGSAQTWAVSLHGSEALAHR